VLLSCSDDRRTLTQLVLVAANRGSEMTQEELDFSGLVGEFKVGERHLREIGYAVFELKTSGLRITH